jgi:hypothetical protein
VATRQKRLRDRPTGDLLVLIIAGTICTIVLMGGIGVVALLLFRPEDPVIAKVVSGLVAIVNTLIGLLAGYIAGASGSGVDLKNPPATQGSSRRTDA